MIPEWVLDGATSRAVHVYGLLMRYADTNANYRNAFPARQTLADRMGCSTDTVDRAIAVLVGIDALTVTPRYDETAGNRRTSNEYRLLFNPPLRTHAEGSLVTDADPPLVTRAEALPIALITDSPLNNTRGSKRALVSHKAVVISDHEWGIENPGYRPQLKNALVSVMGWDPDDMTKDGWGRIEAAAKQLADIGADPTEIPYRAGNYLVNNPGKLTPNALAANWADCASPRIRPSSKDLERAARGERMIAEAQQ